MHTSDCTLVKFILMRGACEQCIISLMKYLVVELFAVINITSFSINKKLFQVLFLFNLMASTIKIKWKVFAISEDKITIGI